MIKDDFDIGHSYTDYIISTAYLNMHLIFL